MDPTIIYVLAAVSAVYAIAVTLKVVGVWNQPGGRYEFTMWDGGLLLRGKTMGKHGAAAFAGVMAILAAVLIYYATQISDHHNRYGGIESPGVEKLARAVPV